MTKDITKEDISKIIDLYIEGAKYYDNLIKEEKFRKGYSDFMINLLDGNINIKELIIDYIKDKI